MKGLIQNNNGFVKAVWQSVEYHIKEYPQSTLKDLYKYFFQDVYGPGDLVNDAEATKKHLLEELFSYSKVVGKIAEPTGFRHNFYRINLSVIKNNLIPIDLYFEAFIKSAENYKSVNIEEWIEEWGKIEIIIRSMQLSLPDYQEDGKEILRCLKAGKYVAHHSQIFNDAYRPHYRIMSTKVVKNN